MARNGKVGTFLVEREATKLGGPEQRKPRLIRGTLRQVENALLGEWVIGPCEVSEAVKLGAQGVVEEDATGEPE